MHIILYDARCPLCTFWVRFIARRDSGKYTFVPILSPFGRALCKRLKIDPRNPGTFALVQGKRARYRSAGILTILSSLPSTAIFAAYLGLLPRGVLNFLYVIVARTRYFVFGRYPQNFIPPELKNRIIQKIPA